MMLLFLLQLKHFVIDFLWQPEYEWKNKGTWGHPGGIIHSAKHSVATFIILMFFTHFSVASVLAALEFVAHYYIDFSKMNINKELGWTANDKNFWYLLGLDQFLHQICYVLIVALI